MAEVTIAEKWTIGVGIIQTVILLVTLIAAICIGMKQNEINEGLLELGYSPKPLLWYEMKSEHLRLSNQGSTNLTFIGGKFNDQPRYAEAGVLISPGDEIVINNIVMKDANVVSEMSRAREKNHSLDLCLLVGNQDYYLLQNTLFATTTSGTLNIHRLKSLLRKGPCE